MEEERKCPVGFGWRRNDEIDEKSIKECFKYAKEIVYIFAGVCFEVSDLSVKITIFFCDEEKENTICIKNIDEIKFKMLCDSIVFAKKLIETFDVSNSMMHRKLHVTVNEINFVFAKIIRAIDNKSSEEYEDYSRKLQDTFKI